MDVAAGGDVVVVLLQLGVVNDAAEFFFFLPPDERVGDAVDAFGRDEVLGVALLEDLAGVDEENLTPPGFRLDFVEEEDDAGCAGVVEEVFGQIEDALDEVTVNEPLADFTLFVLVFVSRTSRSGSGIEQDSGSALLIEARVHVL